MGFKWQADENVSFVSLVAFVALVADIAGESQNQISGRTSPVEFVTDASVASLVTDLAAESRITHRSELSSSVNLQEECRLNLSRSAG
jgi:hypothetical protein